MLSKEEHYVKKLQRLEDVKQLALGKGKTVSMKDEARIDRNIAKRSNSMVEAQKETNGFNSAFDDFLRTRFEIVNKVVAGYIENSDHVYRTVKDHYGILAEDVDMLRQTDYTEEFKEGAFDDMLAVGNNHKRHSWPESLLSLKSIFTPTVTEQNSIFVSNHIILNDQKATETVKSKMTVPPIAFKKKNEDEIDINKNDSAEDKLMFTEMPKLSERYEDFLSLSYDDIGFHEHVLPLFQNEEEDEERFVISPKLITTPVPIISTLSLGDIQDVENDDHQSKAYGFSEFGTLLPKHN